MICRSAALAYRYIGGGWPRREAVTVQSHSRGSLCWLFQYASGLCTVGRGTRSCGWRGRLCPLFAALLLGLRIRE